MIDQCYSIDTDHTCALVTCWGRKPGVDLPARMFEIFTGIPNIVLKADAILKIWPPPSITLPSIALGSISNVNRVYRAIWNGQPCLKLKLCSSFWRIHSVCLMPKLFMAVLPYRLKIVLDLISNCIGHTWITCP